MAFSSSEVESLNAYQAAGAFHPFTCGNDRTDEHHLDGEGLLVATEDGWVCPYCSWRQDWAHEWMKDWSWKHMNEKYISASKVMGYPSNR